MGRPKIIKKTPESAIPAQTPRLDRLVEGVVLSKVPKQPKVEYPIPVEAPDVPLKTAPVLPKKPKNAQRLPDPFEDLPEKTRSYLRLDPYGNNVIIDKKLTRGLLEVFRNIKDMPLPESICKELNIHHDKLRKFLGFISIAEHDEIWKNLLKEAYEPLYPNYKCTCTPKKTRIKKSKEEVTDEE